MVEVDDQEGKLRRGSGRGARFFALGTEVWAQLWQVETSNRLNLVTTYLVLLAGTGSDHQLTKWSAKACEEHTGMGKPRAKLAIEELIRAGLVHRTDASTQMKPQYRLPELDRQAEPIFLPVALVTGLAGETPILRRVREIGDALALRMLIDLYGLVQLDATFGVPPAMLRQASASPARKVHEIGVHAVWALTYGTGQNGSGEWVQVHHDPKEQWQPFWDRVAALRKIGALWFEPWVFESDELDSEPLFPVQIGNLQGATEAAVTKLTNAAHMAAIELTQERAYLLERYASDIIIPLPAHYRQPSLRGVAKLRIEADTPGRRRAYALRMNCIEAFSDAFDLVYQDASAQRYDRPMQVHGAREQRS